MGSTAATIASAHTRASICRYLKGDVGLSSTVLGLQQLQLSTSRRSEGRTSCRCLAQAGALAERDPKDVRVLVVGPTGYIGKFVVKELIERGYQVVAFAREKSGIGGKTSKEQAIKVQPSNRCTESHHTRRLRCVVS